jgi:hypothetical protein
MDFQIHDDPMAAATTGERDIVPAGIHQMEIKAAEEKTNKYKVCDENPHGAVLALRLATVNGNYKFVFDDIPQHLGWRAKQLAQAVGSDVAGGTLSLNPDDLIGRSITVEVSHYTSKTTGNVSAVVKKYMPAVAAKPAAAAPRKAAAKVTASRLPGDDIPF